MEQHEPKGQTLFCLENVTYLLDVTPSNPLPHPLSCPPILLCVIQIQSSVAKQHPTSTLVICVTLNPKLKELLQPIMFSGSSLSTFHYLASFPDSSALGWKHLLCRRGEPGILSHVSTAKGKKGVEKP